MELANTIVTLKPGMYILRYPKGSVAPLSISRAAGSTAHNGRIEALYTPGTNAAVLRNGADCLVMQVLDAPVDLLVTAYMERAGVTVPALRVDALADVTHGGHVSFSRPSREGGGAGIMVERIDWFRAQVPHGVAPENQDGEVERFELLHQSEVCDRVAQGQFTLEAG